LDARLRLFCFPFAGGGAGAFRSWAGALAPDIAVCAVQLPGRETRFREPPFTRLAPLVDTLAGALLPAFDRPFAFFGHSLGALIAFELTRALRRRNVTLPTRLIVAGRGGPHLPLHHSPMHLLPDRELRVQLRNLQGTPTAVLDNDELMQTILPMVRADFAVHETYVYGDEPPLTCPILALGGDADSFAPPTDMATWQEHTTGGFEMAVLPGGHFFLQEHAPQLLQQLRQCLESALPA
jgi:medium-chain acyl-[acyl-carrier-protein] hydrolase